MDTPLDYPALPMALMLAGRGGRLLVGSPDERLVAGILTTTKALDRATLPLPAVVERSAR